MENEEEKRLEEERKRMKRNSSIKKMYKYTNINAFNRKHNKEK
jgi:hypothetical protein